MVSVSNAHRVAAAGVVPKRKPMWGTVGSGRLSGTRHPLPPDTAGVEPGRAPTESSWFHWRSQQLEVSREVSQGLQLLLGRD